MIVKNYLLWIIKNCRLLVLLLTIFNSLSFSQYCAPFERLKGHLISVESLLKQENPGNVRWHIDQSQKELEAAKKECPKNELKDLENKLSDFIKKYQEKRLATVKPSVVTSDFHKQNVFKIVFFKSPQEIKKENPSDISDKFIAGNYIYGLQYFGNTFNEVTNQSCYAYTKVYVDGEEKASHHFKLSGDKVNWSYLELEVLPDPNKSTTQGAKKYAKALSQITPGKHKIKVITSDEYLAILAEGEFELDCTQGIDKIVDISNGLEGAAIGKVEMPKPEKVDVKLEKEMLEAMKKSGWKETPLKVVITQNDWEIKRNALGIIERRVIAACLAMKTPEGKCKLFYVTFSQEYKGRNYGKTEFYGTSARDPVEIQCEKVK